MKKTQPKKALKPGPHQKNLELVKEMAQEAADMIRYVGLDDPSDSYYQTMDEILNSFEDQKRAKVLRKKFDQMPYREVVKLEEWVNDLLGSGKYN